MLGLSAKLYPRISGLAATPDPRIIFIILIITLNLHDPSLSGYGCNTRPNSLRCESDCNTRPNSLGYGSGCKVVA